MNRRLGQRLMMIGTSFIRTQITWFWFYVYYQKFFMRNTLTLTFLEYFLIMGFGVNLSLGENGGSLSLVHCFVKEKKG